MQNELERAKKALQFCASSYDDSVRIQIAKAGFCLESFINDPNAFVRRAVVDNGYKLEKFQFDEDEMVRIGVAIQGFGIDQLIYDKSWKVRKEVAKYKDLNREQINILAKDNAPEVRLEIAKRGEKLSLLYKDSSVMVRKEVAKQGYKLEIFIHDESPAVRVVVAEQGFGIKELLKDEDKSVVQAAKLYGFKNDAISKYNIINGMRVCDNCGFEKDQYSFASKRCPNCNFILNNFQKMYQQSKKKRKASE